MNTSPLLPILSVRPVLDRLTSLARTHERDATLIPGLAVTEEEVAANPPVALEQIVDEFGGIVLRDQTLLTLLVEDRTDVGPYTLLGDAATFYPLFETPEAAVILTLDEEGAPGAVFGIGEDLALHLAAPDLGTYLERFADALAATLDGLDPALEGEERDEAAEQLMNDHLFTQVLGLADPDPALDVPLRSPSDSAVPELPAGALAVADLREAPVGARVDLMEADVPGDPLELHVAWRAGGRAVVLLGG
ncbi:hypothetical protein V1260_04415 [Brachybacterium sp. J144]|uniref:hypothetical protein n=1 Tax=Brachybacterium sp. J144 TaxID=3116487 RepID=UPI002E78C669|nr:hypothetical protein [Brachybacterium sp. J144]MEE1650027.1 hypothetical protein [Brachybacterium sp. J144]